MLRGVASQRARESACQQVSHAWGLGTAEVDANGRRTDLKYDPLGRLTDVWLPGRDKALSASMQFGYTVSRTAPSVVWAKELRNDGSYTTGYTIYDGLLRQRQTQTPSANIAVGRLITDTRYDYRGNPSETNGPAYDDTGGPSGTLLAVSQEQWPSRQVSSFDGANRPTVAQFLSHGVEKWRSTTAYGGDRVSVTPPAGGTATTSITDARGRTTGLRQYHGPAPAGAFDENHLRPHPGRSARGGDRPGG